MRDNVTVTVTWIKGEVSQVCLSISLEYFPTQCKTFVSVKGDCTIKASSRQLKRQQANQFSMSEFCQNSYPLVDANMVNASPHIQERDEGEAATGRNGTRLVSRLYEPGLD